MGQSRPWQGGGETGREREQGENIKEEGQEREREGEERQLERGDRRSPACCQVPGFPSPLYKRARQAWIGGGGSREARGPFTKSPPFTWALHTPTSTPMAAAWVRHYPLFSHLTLQHKPIIKPSAPAQLPSYWCAYTHTPRHKGPIIVHTSRCLLQPRMHAKTFHYKTLQAQCWLARYKILNELLVKVFNKHIVIHRAMCIERLFLWPFTGVLDL